MLAPTPILSRGRISILYASTAISCIAEAHPTNNAKKAVIQMFCTGSVFPKPTNANHTQTCEHKIQLRLKPNNLVTHGMLTRSNIEPQINLIVYGTDTQANKPIIVLLIPASANQTLKVDKISKNGTPLEKPKKKIL